MSDQPTTLNLDELTYGELEIFEQIIGFVPADNAALEEIPKVTMAIAIATIVGRRSDPDLTVETVRNAPVGTYDLTGAIDVNPPTDTTEGESE